MVLTVAAFLVQVSLSAADTANSDKDGLGGFLGGLFKRGRDANVLQSGGLTTEDMNAGIKEALGKGLQSAVAQLGRTNGFLTNVQVHIPLPEQLRTVERGLQKIGQGALVTQFETTLNRAAEQAVPAASEVFVDTVKSMTVADAKELLVSESSTAITEYFRKKSESELSRRFLPIVKQATEKTGVTAGYKQLTEGSGVGRFASLFKDSVNIDDYVTDKALDGLFLMVAEEEKRIRENPVARTTELLEKVFGAIGKKK